MISIIGNIVPPFQKVPFKATDIFITRNEIGYIANSIQEKAIQQIEKQKNLLALLTEKVSFAKGGSFLILLVRVIVCLEHFLIKRFN